MPTHIFLERNFDPALSVAGVHQIIRDGAWCFSLHKVKWKSSYLAAGGRRMICWFEAPDLESARTALRQTGVDARVLWRGTVHEAPSPESVVPNVLVERAFEQPVLLEQIQAIEDGAAWCLEAHRVRFARTFFSIDRKRMLCLYEAPDAESVRVAQHKAAMPVAAAWAFERIGPDNLP